MDLSSEVIGAMITPSVLISAVALLQLSTANRLAKLTDRILHVTKQVESFNWRDDAEDLSDSEQLLLDQMPRLMDRLVLLRSAVIGLYVTIGLLVTTSICLGMHAAIDSIGSMVPTSAALFSAVALLYSIVLLIREAWQAVQITIRETNFAREIWQERMLKRARMQFGDDDRKGAWGEGRAAAMAAQADAHQPPNPL